jgi:hypothetical protein
MTGQWNGSMHAGSARPRWISWAPSAFGTDREAAGSLALLPVPRFAASGAVTGTFAPGMQAVRRARRLAAFPASFLIVAAPDPSLT